MNTKLEKSNVLCYLVRLYLIFITRKIMKDNVIPTKNNYYLIVNTSFYRILKTQNLKFLVFLH